MNTEKESLQGIGVSEGVCIGRVSLLERRHIRIPRNHIIRGQEAFEISRIKTALEKSVTQLESIRTRFMEDGVDHQLILEAHELILKDEELLSDTSKLIHAEKINAEWAFSKIIQQIRSMFEDMNDPYLKERRGDIDFVGERVLRNLVGISPELKGVADVGVGSVLIAHDLSPVDVVILSHRRITAIVTEKGSSTSHTAIIARSLGIPAVVGCKNVFSLAGDGDIIIVDGFSGEVSLHPKTEVLQTARQKNHRYQSSHNAILRDKFSPSITADNVQITLEGNIELPFEASNVVENGGEGIGLYRTEFLYLSPENPPTTEHHIRTYCSIFNELGNTPVTLRLFDLEADKSFGTLEKAAKEPNPALGLRGIRFALKENQLLEDQLEGILRASEFGNFKILIPMLTTLEELRIVKEKVQTITNRLKQEGLKQENTPEIGAMIEVPATALITDQLAEKVDFLSIGTNDLIQYLCAIDRINDSVAYLYNPLSLPVLRMLSTIYQQATTHTDNLTICGEMAGDINCLPALIGLGFRKFSMNAGSIPKAKYVIRRLNVSKCEELAGNILESSISNPSRLIRDYLKTILAADHGLLELLDL